MHRGSLHCCKPDPRPDPDSFEIELSGDVIAVRWLLALVAVFWLLVWAAFALIP